MNPPTKDAHSDGVDFAGLYGRYAADVHRFAWYLCGDRSLADDLTSEAFVRVWTARTRVDFTTVRAYLFAIVRNLYLQDRRRERRLEPLDESAMISPTRDPETATFDHARVKGLMAALARLPEPDRAAVLMRADEQLPYDEIARALGITLSAAKVKVHRARLKLAAALEPAARPEE